MAQRVQNADRIAQYSPAKQVKLQASAFAFQFMPSMRFDLIQNDGLTSFQVSTQKVWLKLLLENTSSWNCYVKFDMSPDSTASKCCLQVNNKKIGRLRSEQSTMDRDQRKQRPIRKRGGSKARKKSQGHSDQESSSDDNQMDSDYRPEKEMPLRGIHEKNYRRNGKLQVRIIKTVADKCLRQMGLSHLYSYWDGENEGNRNRRCLILLILMILEHEGKGYEKEFAKMYKEVANTIIQGSSTEFQWYIKSQNFQRYRRNLNLSIQAIDAVLKSDFNIEAGLTILQQKTPFTYFEEAKNFLASCKTIISSEEHKQSQQTTKSRRSKK